MLGFLAGINQKNMQSVPDFAGDVAPCAVVSFLVVRPKLLGIMDGLDQKDSCVVHLCRGAEMILMVFTVQQTIEIPLFLLNTVIDVPVLQVVAVVDISFVTQRLIPMVLVTMEIPQFFFDKAIDAPVAQVVQIFHVVVQMPIPMVQTVRRTMEIPRLSSTR